MPLQQLNKAIKQLEFLQCLPDQNKVMAAIADSLKPDFKVTMHIQRYFNQISLLYLRDWEQTKFTSNYKYEQSNSTNHKTTALMNVLIKARNHYELQAVSI